LVGSQIIEGFLIFKMIQIGKHLTMDDHHFGYKTIENKEIDVQPINHRNVTSGSIN
jgi:hypothetical protein